MVLLKIFKEFIFPVCLVIVFIVGVNSCNKTCNNLFNDNANSSDTIYLYDTITYHVDVPKPFPVEVIIPDTILDTLYINNPQLCCIELFSKKIYIDTLSNDSNLLAVLRDTVYKNELQNRSFSYQLKKPHTSIINNYNVVKQNGFYPGINLFYSNNRPGIGASILKVHNKNIYGIGADINNNVFFFSFNHKFF